MNDSDSEDSHDSFVTMEEIIPGHDESSDFIEDTHMSQLSTSSYASQAVSKGPKGRLSIRKETSVKYADEVHLREAFNKTVGEDRATKILRDYNQLNKEGKANDVHRTHGYRYIDR